MPKQHENDPHFSKNWQTQLKEAITSIDDLCYFLHLSLKVLPVSITAAQNFAIRVPLSFAECIEKGNPSDPLLRQVLPSSQELLNYAGFSNDPVGDLLAATDSVIHKYHGRVLFITTGNCAVHCRYCFRRNFPYAQLALSKQKQQAAMNAVRSDPSISEIIFSGGDPLLLSDARLASLISDINTIDSVKRIRIHSRVPIVLPARVTSELIKVLGNSSKQIILVVHCNHANELNERVLIALKPLIKHNITLLNQSVLLKGVNDNATVLCRLSEQLFNYGILPYYLHLLDKATGTGHFEVTEQEAVALMNEVQRLLPGYLVPKLVREQAGAAYKLVL